MFQSANLLPRLAFLALVSFGLCVTESANAESDTVTVALDRARIVKLPEGTQTLIIGNPLVADVTMLKTNGSMVITGKSFGATNLIALDGGGNPVAESTIKVTGNDQAVLLLRGVVQESYSCNPRCAPTVALGDDTKVLGDNIGNVRTRNGAALPGAK